MVVCDGGQGIASAVKTTWPTTRIQRCVFHAFSAVKRKTTTRPRTQAGIDLYAIAKALLHIDTHAQAVEWMSRLAAWNTTYKAFLAEQTRLPNGNIVPTHHRLITAKNTLNTLVKQETLFTYLDAQLTIEDDPIPATSNLIEGGINTRTDEEIKNLFNRAIHHSQSQNEINRSGTAVNWTDFHHNGTWHETY